MARTCWTSAYNSVSNPNYGESVKTIIFNDQQARLQIERQMCQKPVTIFSIAYFTESSVIATLSF